MSNNGNVWQKKGTSSEGGGRVVRSWSSRDGKHSKVVAKTGNAAPRQTVSVVIDNSAVEPSEHRHKIPARLSNMPHRERKIAAQRVSTSPGGGAWDEAAHQERKRLAAEAAAKLAAKQPAHSAKIPAGEKIAKQIAHAQAVAAARPGPKPVVPRAKFREQQRAKKKVALRAAEEAKRLGLTG